MLIIVKLLECYFNNKYLMYTEKKTYYNNKIKNISFREGRKNNKYQNINPRNLKGITQKVNKVKSDFLEQIKKNFKSIIRLPRNENMGNIYIKSIRDKDLK